jgi:hypothetical protein
MELLLCAAANIVDQAIVAARGFISQHVEQPVYRFRLPAIAPVSLINLVSLPIEPVSLPIEPVSLPTEPVSLPTEPVSLPIELAYSPPKARYDEDDVCSRDPDESDGDDGDDEDNGYSKEKICVKYCQTPDVPTAPVKPWAPARPEISILSLTKKNLPSRRSLANQFARCAAPTFLGKRKRDITPVVRSVKPKRKGVYYGKV